jgi:immunity protein, SdpI family
VINAIMVFMGALHVVILANAVGWALPVEKLVPAGVGLLFVMLGNYLSRVQPNWFLGIRTPWTLSSDKVWRKTHRIGGALFVVGGIGMVALAFLPPAIVLPVLIAIIALVAGVPIVLSYIFWRKEQGNLAPPADHS